MTKQYTGCLIILVDFEVRQTHQRQISFLYSNMVTSEYSAHDSQQLLTSMIIHKIQANN